MKPGEFLRNRSYSSYSKILSDHFFLQIFREPKQSSQVDEVLTQYAKSIRKGVDENTTNGAILFSVIGKVKFFFHASLFRERCLKSIHL